MKWNFLRLLLYCFILLTFMSTQCGKEPLIEYQYKFLEKIDLDPFQKIYRLGDTIWIKYSNPSHYFYDQISRQRVFSDTFSLPFQISYNSRYGGPVNPLDSFCNLKVINAAYTFFHLDTYGQSSSIRTNCPSDNFRLGIIPKYTGTYSLDIYSLSTIVGGCNTNFMSSIYSTIEYRFNLADCNKDVYLSIPPNSRGESDKGHTERQIDNKEVFVFKVEN